MAEQHNPLQGYPTGMMNLVIDREEHEQITIDATHNDPHGFELEILHATHVDLDAKDQDLESVVLRKVEAQMLRDFLNSPIVSAWLEQ